MATAIPGILLSTKKREVTASIWDCFSSEIWAKAEVSGKNAHNSNTPAEQKFKQPCARLALRIVKVNLNYM
jgi:hypothetical protein